MQSSCVEQSIGGTGEPAGYTGALYAKEAYPPFPHFQSFCRKGVGNRVLTHISR